MSAISHIPRTSDYVTVRCPATCDADGNEIPLDERCECGREITVGFEARHFPGWRPGKTEIEIDVDDIPERCPSGHTFDSVDAALLDERVWAKIWEVV